jgi:excisionase family DNA binding protein
MIPSPHLAREVRKALVAWGHLLRQNGQHVPDGWDTYIALHDVAARTSDAGPPPDWFTLDEAATYARTSVRNLHRWRDDGLPSHRHGGRVLIARDDLERWLRTTSDDVPDRAGHAAA